MSHFWDTHHTDWLKSTCGEVLLHEILLPSQFWPIPSMSRRVINCAKLCLSHPFDRIKWIRQWAVDRDPVLTSTTSAKIGKTEYTFRHRKCTTPGLGARAWRWATSPAFVLALPAADFPHSHAPHAPNFRGVIGACHSQSKHFVSFALQGHPPGQRLFVGGVCSGCVSSLLWGVYSHLIGAYSHAPVRVGGGHGDGGAESQL